LAPRKGSSDPRTLRRALLTLKKGSSESKEPSLEEPFGTKEGLLEFGHERRAPWIQRAFLERVLWHQKRLLGFEEPSLVPSKSLERVFFRVFLASLILRNLLWKSPLT